jgi:hypothetical protein
MTQGWASPDVDRTFQRSTELLERLGESPHRLMVLSSSTSFHVMRGHISQALGLGRQVLETATPHSDAAAAGDGPWILLRGPALSRRYPRSDRLWRNGVQRC